MSHNLAGRMEGGQKKPFSSTVRLPLCPSSGPGKREGSFLGGDGAAMMIFLGGEGRWLCQISGGGSSFSECLAFDLSKERFGSCKTHLMFCGVSSKPLRFSSKPGSDELAQHPWQKGT